MNKEKYYTLMCPVCHVKLEAFRITQQYQEYKCPECNLLGEIGK